MLAHYVRYMLMFGHENKQVYFRDTHYRMFHVEQFRYPKMINQQIGVDGMHLFKIVVDKFLICVRFLFIYLSRGKISSSQ